MIEHCVFCQIRPDASKEALVDVMGRLASVKDLVDGMIAFRAGENRDYENKTGKHNHGFICTFRDREAHLAYEGHPVHAAAGRDLVGLCVGGYDGIMVYDLEV